MPKAEEVAETGVRFGGSGGAKGFNFVDQGLDGFSKQYVGNDRVARR